MSKTKWFLSVLVASAALIACTAAATQVEPVAPGCLEEAADGSFVTAEGGCKDTAPGGKVWSLSAYAAGAIGGSSGRSAFNWYEARDYCGALVEGGKDDWRMPILTEMREAYGHGAYGHVQLTPYPSLEPLLQWSATLDKSKRHAYAFQFADGSERLGLIYNKQYDLYSTTDVVCVRDGL